MKSYTSLKLGKLMFIMVASYFAYVLLTGQERMDTQCAQVKDGTTKAQLEQFARNYGYEWKPQEPGTTQVVLEETRSGGHFKCKFDLINGTVQTQPQGKTTHLGETTPRISN